MPTSAGGVPLRPRSEERSGGAGGRLGGDAEGAAQGRPVERQGRLHLAERGGQGGDVGHGQEDVMPGRREVCEVLGSTCWVQLIKWLQGCVIPTPYAVNSANLRSSHPPTEPVNAIITD